MVAYIKSTFTNDLFSDYNEFNKYFNNPAQTIS